MGNCVISRDPLPAEVAAAVKELFDKIDTGKDGTISIAEAEKFWSAGKLGRFGKMSAAAMFNEVDANANQKITYLEWVAFWTNVRNSKDHQYTDADITEEIKAMAAGEAWRDWDDGTTPSRRGSAAGF